MSWTLCPSLFTCGRRSAIRATLRYANEEAKRQALPDDEQWRQTVLSACLAQEPSKLELDYEDAWWRAWITPLGEGSILVAYWDYTAQKQHERSLKASERLNREILSGLQEGVVVVDTDARVVRGQRGGGGALRRAGGRADGPPAERDPARPARRARAPAHRRAAAADARAGGRGGLRRGRALRAPRRLAAVGRGPRQPAAPRRRRALRRGRRLRRRHAARRAGPPHALRGRHRRADRAGQPARAGAHAGGRADPCAPRARARSRC